jgi:hypothetical protein
VEWKLRSNVVLPPHDDDLREKAAQLAYGINTAAAVGALWELAPWSWFTDWFTNVGDFLIATNNALPITYQNICIMVQREAKAQHTLTQPLDPRLSLSGMPVEEMRIKERFTHPTLLLPFLPTKFPFLDHGKWSILSSLAVLKAKVPGKGWKS